MNFSNPWNVEHGNSRKENLKLRQYFEENDGLAFTEFNTTQGMQGKMRALDAILFPGLEGGVYKSAGNYSEIEKLIQENPVKLIEVHKWGFYGFGQLIGKEKLVKEHWDPKEIQKVLITLSPERYHPERNPDPLTKEVFDEFDVEVFVPDSNKS